MNKPPDIRLKPAVIFAVSKTLPFILASLAFLILAWSLTPVFLCFSFLLMVYALYRFVSFRHCLYIITPEVIKIRRGVLIRRFDQVELFRMKDYIIVQSLFARVFRLMDVTLKSSDPENPVLCLQGIPESDLVDIIRNYVKEARRHNQIVEIN